MSKQPGNRVTFEKHDEFTLPLTDEQVAMIEERLGERVDELTLSSHEVPSGSETAAGLRVLEINNVIFGRVGDATFVAN